jgi:uncharacterized cupin superfamily protein
VKRVNLNEAEIKHDGGEPEGYDAGYARLGPGLGASTTGATMYELVPGQSICPYHYEVAEEEWLLVLEGRPTIRHPEGEDELAPGDIAFFPTGPAGAHKVTNHGETTARVLMFSNRVTPAIAVYPDSEKVGIFVDYPEDRLMLRRGPNLDYWDGEGG